MDILDKFQLKEWWLQALTSSQRELIDNNYRTSLGDSSPPSIHQDVANVHFDEGFGKFGLLLTLSCIADDQAKQVIITKAETGIAQEYTEPSSNLIDIHVALASIIKHHYSLRSEVLHYDKAKELCLLQIAISSKTAKKFRHPKKPEELVKLHKMTGMKHRARSRTFFEQKRA